MPEPLTICSVVLQRPPGLGLLVRHENNISHWFDAAKKMAGKECMKGFLKRNPDISLKQPTATGID
jgi:hypothetical protein